jgi:hypothetical protein
MQVVDIQDRTYLMLQGAPWSTLQTMYPGRKYLVDAGTNRYSSGLAWFVDTYKDIGVEFDEIFAWEAQQYKPDDYWREVPADVARRLHFYNQPIQAEPSAKMNPLAWIRHKFKPGDYIVFKLDIDNDELEDKFIRQIAESGDLKDMIAEMFFEKHFDSPDMRPWFGSPATSYLSALAGISKLRAAGIRIHYWP